MKKLIVLVFMLIGLMGYSQQVGDATIKTYADTYLNTNNVGSITGAQLNQVLNYLISSKVNHDSATIVRIAVTNDSLFITYYGFAEDTIPLATVGDSSLWSLASNITYTKNSGNVRITAGDLFPSVDGTYNLGTPSYGWDTLFLSSVIDYGSNLIFSYGGTKAVLTTAGNLGIGDNSPDSAISTTGGKFTTDILIGGGWKTWIPTLNWTGGEPAVSEAVYRYEVTNNRVNFVIQLKASNSSGSTTTDFDITLPVTPRDIDAYVVVSELTALNGSTFARDWGFYIDAKDNTANNRKLYTGGTVSIPNGDYYQIWIAGFYEITSK